MRKHWICLLLAVALLPCASLAQAPEVDMDAGVIRYESKASVSITSVLPLQDGTLLITVSGGDALPKGPVAPVEDEDSAPFPEVARKVALLRIAADGQVLWEQSFGESEGSLGLRLLCEAEDGTVLALAELSIRQRTQYQQLQRFSIQDGTLIGRGEKLTGREDIRENAYPIGGGYLWTTIHNSGTTTVPRYYALSDTDNNYRWTVDQAQTVLVLEQALSLPNGTLLLGKGWPDGLNDYRACAALVDGEGNVVWQKDYVELGPSSFLHCAVSPSGKLAALALVGSVGESRQYVLVVIDADSGVLRTCAAFPAKDVRLSEIASCGDGWLIAGECNQQRAPTLRFIQADADGTLQKTWDESFDAEAVYSPKLFTWNSALWGEIKMETEDSQVAWLQRILP